MCVWCSSERAIDERVYVCVFVYTECECNWATWHTNDNSEFLILRDNLNYLFTIKLLHYGPFVIDFIFFLCSAFE